MAVNVTLNDRSAATGDWATRQYDNGTSVELSGEMLYVFDTRGSVLAVFGPDKWRNAEVSVQ